MNDNNKRIIIKILIYLLIFACLCLYGVTHSYALEIKTLYSTNSSGTLGGQNTYTYGYINQGGVQTTATASVNTTISGRALGLIFYTYETVTLNKTYTMEINFMSTDLINTFTSNMVQIATCNGNVCNDNVIVSVVKNNPNSYSSKLTIQFNPITTGGILLVNLSDKTATRLITGETTFGIKSVTLDSVNVNQDIIDNQTNNTNNIISNNNSNTEDIINNQNANAQAIINAQYTCKVRSITLNDYIEYKGYVMNSSASLSSNSNYSVTELIKIKTNSPYTINLNYTTSNRYCLFDSNLNLIECPSYSGSREVNFNSSSAEYIRFTIRVDTSDKTTFFGGNICLKDSQEQTNAINDLNDLVSDSSGPDVSGFSNVAGWLPAGPIDSILTLPLGLYNAYNNSLNSTCTDLDLPIPFINQNIQIPCIRTLLTKIGIIQYWDTFGFLIAGVLLYNYLLNLYHWYDNVTSLKSTTLTGRSDFGGDV